MAQLDFPLNPALNQVYTAGQGSWIWDGIKWESAYSAQLYLPLTGGSLASPGNLTVGGTLHVTGTTALGVLTAGSSTLSALTVTPGTTTLGTLSITGNVNPSANVLIVNGQVSSIGSSAGFGFLGRDTGNQWLLYAQAGSARIWYGSDVCSVDTAGNFNAVNSVQCNGVYFQNSGGNFWSPQSIWSNSEVRAAGAIWTGGIYWQNNGGAMYCPWAVTTNGNLTANGGVVYLAGMYWQNNNGYMYTPWSIHTDNAVNIAGLTWSNNGGWMYTGSGVWCANINTGPIQCNSQAINGCAATYTNGTAYGGWGAQYNWTGNGNWVSFQCTDAFYTYNNQGLAGGIYWTYCDERMKSNFRPVTRDCLAAIGAIELKSFDFSEGHPRQRRTNPEETRPEYFLWEDLPRIVKRIETGFIAQQLREIIPEAVPEPLEEGAYLSVDMRPMVATLIGAVQQLAARLEALEK